MPDYSDLNPANLKPGLTTPDGLNLKPSLVTPAYSGGTPSAANQIKPHLRNADGSLKAGLLTPDGLRLKPSLLSGGEVPEPFVPVNLIHNSEDFGNASWAKTRLTVSANATAAPTGAVTADKIIATADNSDHKMFAAITGTPIDTYTLSAYIKAAEYSWIVLYDSAAGKGQYFDVSNGVLGSTFISSPTSAAIVSAGNGWWRCSITFASAGNKSAGIYIAEANLDPAFAGDGSGGLYVWGVQLEIGGTVNQYVPTP